MLLKIVAILTIFLDLYFFMSTSNKEKIDDLDFFYLCSIFGTKKAPGIKNWETLTSGSRRITKFR